jgi:hypothetical protein
MRYVTRTKRGVTCVEKSRVEKILTTTTTRAREDGDLTPPNDPGHPDRPAKAPVVDLADQPAKYVKLTDLPARLRLTPYQPGDTSISFDVEILPEGGAERAIPFRTDAPKRRKKR